MNFPLSFEPRRRAVRGFSLVELVVAVGALATITGLGLVSVRQAGAGARQHALQSDINRLNAAVRVYLAHGGSLPVEVPAEAVLARLKTKPTNSSERTVVGVGGPFLDERLAGIPIAKPGKPRAVWNSNTQRFVLRHIGAGFRAFTLEAPVSEVPVREPRATAQAFASHGTWVWDYQEAPSQPSAPRPVDRVSSQAGSPRLPALTASLPSPLLSPVPSLPPGFHPLKNFPLTVTLSNPNPPGSAQLFYALNDEPWAPYIEGSPLSLPPEPLSTRLRAYAAATEAMTATGRTDSPSSETLYHTLFFQGRPTALFHTPTASTALVSNLAGNQMKPSFEWGRLANGFSRGNSMRFTPAADFTVEPDEEFKLGELHYHNGTVIAGTSATNVTLRIGLNLRTPESREEIDFNLRLISTPNQHQNEDADADSIWISTPAHPWPTQIHGQTFYLQLRFGAVSDHGFTTLDEFHVHEDKTATSAVYATLTTRPTP